MFNLLYYVTMRKHDDIRQHQLASLYHVIMYIVKAFLLLYGVSASERF